MGHATRRTCGQFDQTKAKETSTWTCWADSWSKTVKAERTSTFSISQELWENECFCFLKRVSSFPRLSISPLAGKKVECLSSWIRDCHKAGTHSGQFRERGNWGRCLLFSWGEVGGYETFSLDSLSTRQDIMRRKEGWLWWWEDWWLLRSEMCQCQAIGSSGMWIN